MLKKFIKNLGLIFCGFILTIVLAIIIHLPTIIFGPSVCADVAGIGICIFLIAGAFTWLDCFFQKIS